MTSLRTVDVFPPTGFVDQPWRDDPDEDAFVRSSRRVCERYSEALREVVPPLPDRFSRLLIMTDRHIAEHVELEVDVSPPSAVGEWATATLPDGVRSLTAADRGLLVLEVIDLTMRTLAGARGWDAEALDRARRHVEAHHLGYGRVGAWKASPSRTLKARVRSELADDGFARTWVDVVERGSERPVRGAGPFRGFSTREGLRRAERTLRWHGSGEVRLVPMVGLFGDEGDVVTVDVQGSSTSRPDAWPDDAPTAPGHGGAPWTTRPTVLLRGAPEDDVEPHEIRIGGGGSFDPPCRDYLDALYRYLVQLTEPEWSRWWSESTARRLEVNVWTYGETSRIALRCSGTYARAGIHRPTLEMDRGRQAALTARQDALALVDTVRRRFGLGPPPALREGAELGIYQAMVDSTTAPVDGP